MLIEFAVVLPILLLLVFGIFYFSLFMNYSNDETHLASEAARFAAVNSNPGGSSQSLQAYVLSQAPGGLTSTNGDVISPAKVYLYFPAGSSGDAGDALRACVTAKVQFLPLFSLGSQTITQTATMRLEQNANWSPDTPPAQCPTS